ncbi:hypothetical protein VQH23_16105 [Pararoseomonas sp. SCSIO 73927]|uniref:hypothetical protein n=1 Tax=Pararoseomonas sp. SCSIO 73927 TaxID=3114537 RepID=UPI0030D3FAB4
MNGPVTYPFRTAEDAWFWTMARLVARQEGAKPPAGPPRPCTADDVVLVLDRLIKAGALHYHHAIVLRTWGEVGMLPDGPRRPGSHGLEQCQWDEAMRALDAPLRAKGFVGEAAHG